MYRSISRAKGRTWPRGEMCAVRLSSMPSADRRTVNFVSNTHTPSQQFGKRTCGRIWPLMRSTMRLNRNDFSHCFTPKLSSPLMIRDCLALGYITITIYSHPIDLVLDVSIGQIIRGGYESKCISPIRKKSLWTSQGTYLSSNRWPYGSLWLHRWKETILITIQRCRQDAGKEATYENHRAFPQLELHWSNIWMNLRFHKAQFELSVSRYSPGPATTLT